MSTSRCSTLMIVLALALSSLSLASCAGQAPTPRTNCAPGLYEYKGGCLDGVSQNFVTCTETHSSNLSVEEKQKFGASVDLGIQSGGGVVEISKTVVETQLPEVALEIVRDCLELSKNVASPVEQLTIEQQVEALNAILGTLTKGTISLDPDRGPYDQVIGVSGTDWPPNVEVEVTAVTSRVRTTTADNGSFQTTITLDPKFESVSPTSIEIRVSPVEASMQMEASALYEIVK
jgi:hypothetical protein